MYVVQCWDPLGLVLKRRGSGVASGHTVVPDVSTSPLEALGTPCRPRWEPVRDYSPEPQSSLKPVTSTYLPAARAHRRSAKAGSGGGADTEHKDGDTAPSPRSYPDSWVPRAPVPWSVRYGCHPPLSEIRRDSVVSTPGYRKAPRKVPLLTQMPWLCAVGSPPPPGAVALQGAGVCMAGY